MQAVPSSWCFVHNHLVRVSVNRFRDNLSSGHRVADNHNRLICKVVNDITHTLAVYDCAGEAR